MNNCTTGKIIPAENVRLVDSPSKAAQASQTSPPSTPAAAHKEHEPHITLVKDGATVQAIVVQCTCGAIIRLDCAD